MNPRLLFPGLTLFKKDVNERFLTVTREIYKNHPVYTYLEEEADSNVLIYPSYADTEHDGKQPRIISKAGAYNYHLMDTMNNNMASEIVRDGSVVGHKNSQIIPITITLLIHAYAEEESSDMADELASLIVFACRRMYSAGGMVVRGVQVSETDLFNKEQKLYQTAATVSLDVPWTNSQSDMGPPIGDVIVETEEPPLIFDTYRSPGVSVFKEKNKDI